MHAVIGLKGWKRKFISVVEGMCNFVSYMWLKEIDLRDLNECEKKLRDYHIYMLEHNRSKIYGDGFRWVKRTVEMSGLDTTLKQIAIRRKIPKDDNIGLEIKKKNHYPPTGLLIQSLWNTLSGDPLWVDDVPHRVANGNGTCQLILFLAGS
ncbi:hypothetical protein Dsin_031411 [Dipteronia sinensis]|uniref:Protein DA1-like domain-containing protein n=1 Tax=Dipteronia sinensis TaxID=43782 RepID=A0AAD9ZME4_9ROSI|nr:hypothetical protein Dsin_031411 [Dipteronia sinensis]